MATNRDGVVSVKVLLVVVLDVHIIFYLLIIVSIKLGLWADALHGSTRLIFFLQYIHLYIYNK